MKTLHVLLGGNVVGRLDQTDGGDHQFTYAEGASQAISVAIPLRQDAYRGRVVDPFLEGLLPDRLTVRENLALRFEVSARNPFALLEHIGMDCAGAIQFVPEDRLEDALAGIGSLVSVSEVEIAARLGAIERGEEPSWIAPGEGWSLAGAQTKIALHREGDAWYEARGAMPTTHILKPGISRMKEQALGEHLCLAALREIGIAAAHTEYAVIGDQEVLIVRRYDRYVTPDGAVGRIHQEDFCQATRTYPRRKYEADGGPGAVTMVKHLATWCEDEGASARRFVDALILNILMGAPDAHSKNYSLLHVGGRVTLAPLYDIASGLPYKWGAESFGGSGELGSFRTSAMAIGGERALGRITGSRWRRFAQQADLAGTAHMTEAQLLERIEELSLEVPRGLERVIQRESATNMAFEGKKIPAKLLQAVTDRCAEVRASLGH